MKISDPGFFTLLKDKPAKEKNGRIYFVNSEDFSDFETDSNKIKTFFKNFPIFYNFLQLLLTPALSCVGGLSEKKAIQRIYKKSSLKGKVILNIGSGTKRENPEIINVDIQDFKNVDVVADVKQLPFKDDSADMVIVDAVLEHIENYTEAIKEISRVVKHGGFIYASVPFMYPFHASPNDFYRWTLPGIEKSFNQFNVIESGLRGGPAGALQGILMHFFAIIFSFRIEKLYIFLSYFFMILFSPIKLLDFLFRFFPLSKEVASHIYFLGQKKS